MAPKPPGTRSLAATPLITMPCRSSKASDLACSLRVWSGSTGGRSDQRPLTVGGPECDGSDPRPKPGRRLRRLGDAPRAPDTPGVPIPGRPPGCQPAAGARPLSLLVRVPFGWSAPPGPPGPVPFPEPGPRPGPASPAGPGPGAHDLPAESKVRSGARVSFVTRPAQTRSQIVTAIA